MLEATRPWGAPVRPYRSPVITTRIARQPWERRGYYRLRRAVFVGEQRLFRDDDRDAHDSEAVAIVALDRAHGMLDQVVGAVRIYRAAWSGSWISDGRTFFGGRLAVARPYRRDGAVARELIAAAVCAAKGLSCDEFLATVQLPAVSFFERNGFVAVRPTAVCGVPHVLMRADLGYFASEEIPA